MSKINLLVTITTVENETTTPILSDSPSAPTHTPQTWSQRFLFVESAVWVWSEVPAPEYQLSSHSWRCTWTEGCVMLSVLNLTNHICVTFSSEVKLISRVHSPHPYLWNRKKIKSLWLWKVTTCRPKNCGSCGKRAANSRPMLWPRRVEKLFKITSG